MQADWVRGFGRARRASLVALSLAGPAFGAADPVALPVGAEPLRLGLHVEILRDDRGERTLDNVFAPAIAARFEPVAQETHNFGYTRAAYWYRARLRNTAAGSDAPTEFVLNIDYAVLDYLDLHISDADGVIRTILTGDLRQPAAQELRHRTFAVPFTAAPGEEIGVHLRVRNIGSHIVPLTVWAREGFQAHALWDAYWNAAYLGILLVMVLYNLTISIATRDRAYRSYVLWLGAVLGCAVFFLGHARIWLGPLAGWAPALISGSVPYWWTGASLASVLFVRDFLGTRERAPRIHGFTNGLMGLGAAVLLSAPWLWYDVSVRLGMAHLIVSIVSGLAIAVWLLRHGVRAARFYLVAWAGFLATVLLIVLSIFDVLPPSVTATALARFGQLGALFAVVVLSLALADRLTTERRERERLSRLKRFFAPQVAEAIISEGEGALLAPARRDVTVLFTDLRGFTAFVAQSEPEDVFRVLHEYRELIVGAADRHGGTLEHFTGDGVMVFFNAPLEVKDPEACAVRMAFELGRDLRRSCDAWRKAGHTLDYGIGIACGYATVGAVGFKGRFDYSVLGTVTNLAARLCAQAQGGQILVPQPLLGRIENLVVAENLGERQLKGLPRPLPVFNLATLTEQGTALDAAAGAQHSSVVPFGRAARTHRRIP